MTSLTDAITKQNQRIFDICLSSSNLSENELDDALILAVKQKSTECVGKLLKAGADKRCPKQQPPETCPVKLAFDKCLCDIIKLFIISGYDNSHVKLYLSQYRDMEGYAELSRWQYHSHDVMSLRSMCRLWIRHYLGNMFYHNLLTLPVPDRIRQYLLMKELDEV
ncbi:hypothetical protein LOTGIDRAFT_167731 [Lottia gigantea]|uniref:SOCS box domain-containing protein n=1 Tax=Lottia gigantea TaxID=225164 RepID=V3ZT65_LOTGI|nr:hypothetical protein LOTGIDRAFT_167731 [Lottia gigantea]ESO85760.1 hypothetical protein LOTGIDRAFT_167731 [Lottia gigantea]